MKTLRLILCIVTLAAIPFGAQSQIDQKIRTLLAAPADSLTQQRKDSLSTDEVQKIVEEYELRQQNLLLEIERLALGRDSTRERRAELRRRIDSLRKVTTGIPLTMEGDTLLIVYANIGSTSAAQRVEHSLRVLQQIADTYSMQPDSVRIESSDIGSEIVYGDRVLISVVDRDALWENTSIDTLALRWRGSITESLAAIKQSNSLSQWLKRAMLFLLVIIGQVLMFKLINWGYTRLKGRIERTQRLRPLRIHDYELLTTAVQIKMIAFAVNIVRYMLWLLLLVLTVPLLFALFPKTETLAMTILSYIITPLKSIIAAFVEYIPNLFVIALIITIIHYILKLLNYLAGEVASGKLKLSGFYPDWAYPTYNIVRFLLYAFMVAMIYPYLPGSNSGIFQGISVFVGLIISLGSSTVIANVIAGMVITYMRPFKLGDRIQLNDTTGNVIEKTPFVTRIRTPKNEVVTIPNSFIMSSHTTNYTASADDYGLIIHSEVSIGYDVPWRKVHQLLLEAAAATDGIERTPEPFVLETSLKDWYPIYQINGFTKNADDMAAIYSRLHQNIQDAFDRAEVEILSPTYIATRNGNASTVTKPAE